MKLSLRKIPPPANDENGNAALCAAEVDVIFDLIRRDLTPQETIEIVRRILFHVGRLEKELRGKLSPAKKKTFWRFLKGEKR